MDISQSGPAHKPDQAVRNRHPNPRGIERRTAFYAERLAALHHEIARNSRLLDDPRHAERRELLVMRLDETQARAADVFACLIEARGQQQQHRIAS